MRRILGFVLAVMAGIVIALTPAAANTVYAHGHHGNGHHGNSTESYYYCGGHEAHYHENGVCPYAGEEYYYCGGHEAHCHENGVCPYAGEEYYYCEGHEAHLHENGVCPYASSGTGTSEYNIRKYYGARSSSVPMNHGRCLRMMSRAYSK